MWYEICVACKRPVRHVFATRRGSILNSEEAHVIANQLEKAFPSDEYTIIISRITQNGTELDRRPELGDKF